MYLKNVRWISVDSFTTDVSSLTECFHSSSTSRLELLYHEWCSRGAKTAHRHQLSLSHNATFLASKQIVVLVSDKCQRWSVSMNSSAACCIFVLLFFIFIKCIWKTRFSGCEGRATLAWGPSIFHPSVHPSSSFYPSIHLVFYWIHSSSNIKMTTKCISFEFCVDYWKGNLKFVVFGDWLRGCKLIWG